jgi:hypothetical protein
VITTGRLTLLFILRPPLARCLLPVHIICVRRVRRAFFCSYAFRGWVNGRMRYGSGAAVGEEETIENVGKDDPLRGMAFIILVGRKTLGTSL